MSIPENVSLVTISMQANCFGIDAVKAIFHTIQKIFSSFFIGSFKLRRDKTMLHQELVRLISKALDIKGWSVFKVSY